MPSRSAAFVTADFRADQAVPFQWSIVRSTPVAVQSVAAGQDTASRPLPGNPDCSVQLVPSQYSAAALLSLGGTKPLPPTAMQAEAMAQEIAVSAAGPGARVCVVQLVPFQLSAVGPDGAVPMASHAVAVAHEMADMLLTPAGTGNSDQAEPVHRSPSAVVLRSAAVAEPTATSELLVSRRQLRAVSGPARSSRLSLVSS